MVNNKKAAREFFEGHFETAYQLYSDILRTDPENMTIMESLGTIELYKNNANEALKYFANPLKKLTVFNIIKNMTLNIKMAWAYYRLDDMAKAAEHFRKASKILGIGLIKDICALSEHCAMFADNKIYEIYGKETTEIDLTASDPLPVLKVSVNGSEDVYFFIDTGGMEVILDDTFAKNVNAVLCNKGFRGGYAGNKKGITRLGKIDSLQMKDLIIKNLPVHILPLGDISKIFGGIKISGVIGTRFLMHFLSTIDYKNKKLILTQPGKNQYDIAADAAVIPFWLVDSHNIVAEGTVNNSESMLMFIDTGLANGGFTANEDFLNKIGIKLNWAEANIGVGGAGEVKVLDINICSLTLGQNDNQVIRKGVAGKAIQGGSPTLGISLGFKLNGLVSHTFFSSGFLTLDFQKMQLVMSKHD